MPKPLEQEKVQQLLLMAKQGHSIAEIAATLGIGLTCARKYCKLYNAKAIRPWKKITQKEQIRQMLQAGIACAKIAAKVGVSDAAVRQLADKWGIDRLRTNKPVSMEQALNPEECMQMRMFLRAVVTYHKKMEERGLKFDVGKFMHAWRKNSTAGI